MSSCHCLYCCFVCVLNQSLLFSPRLVVLSVVLFGLPYGSDQSCSVTLVDHGRGYLGILVSCLICESAIMWLSMRGSILYTQPREAVQYVIYIRLGIRRVAFVSRMKFECVHTVWMYHIHSFHFVQLFCWWSWCTLWWELLGSSSITSRALMSLPKTWRWVSERAKKKRRLAVCCTGLFHKNLH